MNDFATEIQIDDGFNSAPIKEGLFKYIESFGIISLKSGKDISLKSENNEIGLVIFSGKCDISINGRIYKNIGSREDVFYGYPTGVYIPTYSEYTIFSHGVEIGVCSSKCDKKTDFAIIEPNNIKIMQVGKDNWQREVRIIIGPNSPSVNLIVGETINPPGNWSGTPPHKHENTNPPYESLHEELYYFKTEKPEAFGVQRLYSSERSINELILLKENTVTFMPYGYHQIVAGPGYTLYYLFFLSGKGKELIGLPDPAHKWLNENA